MQNFAGIGGGTYVGMSGGHNPRGCRGHDKQRHGSNHRLRTAPAKHTRRGTIGLCGLFDEVAGFRNYEGGST